MQLNAPLSKVCDVLDAQRSTIYARRSALVADNVIPLRRRGPAGAIDDEQLVALIRQVLADSPFTGEGYRKVRAWLRREHGVQVSGKRGGPTVVRRGRYESRTSSGHDVDDDPLGIGEAFDAVGTLGIEADEEVVVALEDNVLDHLDDGIGALERDASGAVVGLLGSVGWVGHAAKRHPQDGVAGHLHRVPTPL